MVCVQRFPGLPNVFKTFFFIILFSSYRQEASAQLFTTACPPNIGFELGNFSNWQTNTGTVSVSGTTNLISIPPNNWLPDANTTGRQDLMDRRSTSPTTDPYGGFPVNPVNGGRYALKLGSDADMGVCGQNRDSCPNAQAEAARYVIKVPANATDASLTFSYAVVLENPLDAVNRHRDEEQPRFNVRMYDPVTGEVIPCGDFGFMASGPLPGFVTSRIRKHRDAVVKFKPWSSVYVNLSNYPGRTFYLEFTTADCTKGGHFGYAYVDLIECGVSAKSLYRCAAPDATTLLGPPGFASYQWYNTDFSTLLGRTEKLTLTPSPPLGTRYWVVAIPYSNTGCSTCDCRDTVGLTVAVTYPTAMAGDDLLVCPGKPVSIGADPFPDYSYLWSPAAGLSSAAVALPTATITTPVVYTLTVTDTLGCVARDTVVLTVYEPVTVKANSAAICTYDSASLQASGAASYLWSPGAGLSSTTIANPVAHPSATTQYTVIGTDSVKCFSDTALVTVTVKPTPTVSLGPDQTLSIGELYPLKTTVTNGPISTWLWAPANSLSCTTCPEPVAEIKWNSQYTVEVKNTYGCVARDTLLVRTICENSSIFIPNAFTPDGDGVNDVFMVQGKNIYVVKSLRIFNRWGELVFEKLNIPPNNPAYGWDGKIRGVVGPPDVFVYTAEVLCGGEKATFLKGNVSLLK